MIFVNEATSSATLPREVVKTFLRVLAPYAPHLAEELSERLGEKELIAHARWPEHDASLMVEETVTLVVQVNGKRRDRIEVGRDADRAAIEAAALQAPGVVRALEGKKPKSVIVVPGRLVNVVA